MFKSNFFKGRQVVYWSSLLVFLFLTQTAIAKTAIAPSHNQEMVSEKMLANGLKVLVKEDHRAPVVVSQVWYKVGSSYESSGITGVSHALEHMMFKGTHKYPGDSFNKIVSRNGAEDNAFTSRDYTAYYQKMEKSRLEMSFDLESDRMRNLILPKEDFLKEIMVVQEERRWRTEDKPQALLYEQLYVTAFDNSGYHHPIIGWMEDLKKMTVDDLKQWYETYYSPNNAILVVVGDVDTDEVFALAEKYFAPIKPFPNLVVKKRTERAQRSTKRVDLIVPAKTAYINMAFKVPVINTAKETWEPYALELMSGILDGGDSTRLNQELVKGQQLAASAGTGYYANSRLDNLFILDGTPAKGKNIQQLEQALLTEIDKLKQAPVSNEELERVKNQIVAAAVYEKDSIFYQAMKIGQAEASGVGWKTEAKYVQRIREITPAQIQQVAQKYFVPKNMTVAVLDPQPADKQPAVFK